MRLPRFSLRTLMVAVATIGLLVGLGIEGERRRKHFRMEQIDHYMCKGDAERERHIFSNPVVLDPGRIAVLDLRIAYHEQMARKYAWAERYPWLPVWPDPPEPK
jgi:hypothetical protein